MAEITLTGITPTGGVVDYGYSDMPSTTSTPSVTVSYTLQQDPDGGTYIPTNWNINQFTHFTTNESSALDYRTDERPTSGQLYPR